MTEFRKNLITLQKPMLSFAYHLTSDMEQARELLQETVLKVLTNEKKYEANTNFKAWVLTIMRNIFINNYREKTRHAMTVDNTKDAQTLSLYHESKLETPEGLYSTKEILRAINNISEHYRTPFNMFVAGFKYTEIAKKLNMPLGTAKSRVFHVRRLLQDELKEFKH